MVDLIKEQKEKLKEFEKGSNVVVIDYRRSYVYREHESDPFRLMKGEIPEITGDSEKAKEMLRDEFENLCDKVDKWKESVTRMYQYNPDSQEKNNRKEPPKVKWWDPCTWF